MRYVEGTDLRTLLHEGGALEPERAIAIVRQVAAALDAAHEQGLVHRDVKPGNVLLARQRGSEAGEHVYLSDFGLTKRSASDSGITGTGQFVGTLDYAAPEQFKGGTPDARTDVYSLGCVLFECLTGHPPFTSENDAGLMYAHLQEPPPAVTADRPELPTGIDGVVTRAWRRHRRIGRPALVDSSTKPHERCTSEFERTEGPTEVPLRTLVPCPRGCGRTGPRHRRSRRASRTASAGPDHRGRDRARRRDRGRPRAQRHPGGERGRRHRRRAQPASAHVPDRRARLVRHRGATADVRTGGREHRMPAARPRRTDPRRTRVARMPDGRPRGALRAVPDAGTR